MSAVETRARATCSAVRAPASSAPAAPVATDRWIRGAGTPYPVFDLLVVDGWTLVLDDLADMHCASPDGRVYVGYLAASPRPRPGDVWHVSVEAADGLPGWEQTFHRDVPAEVIAGLVHALLTTAPRPDVEAF
ncbi:hypothetical protein GCM10023205_04510 [Yinghuangia aomiensis]|uniref:DUF317 domain-containing protein n=1 Tax=Yinghuangia aomiensis TaxID=676205 RepID=A0ABP9GLS7_9ACTN